ncbi:nodulation-signaling pathway 1 protein-like protein [Tanacetum coccineum]
MAETMLFDEPDLDLDSGHILDWLEDSMPSLPSLLDDLYGSTDISDDWWGSDPFEANNISTSNSAENLASPVSSTFTSSPVDAFLVYDEPQEPVPVSDVSKKRKAPDDHIQMTQTAPQAKRSNGNKKGNGKSTKENSNSGNNKGGRWAEQLLNPCASAISSGNVTRVQHLLFVLQELASPTGDANYRLASHGMQALLHHISSATNTPAKVMTPAITFATSTPKFFQKSLINFNDINPWFTIPNNIANNAILQVLSEQDQKSCKTLHILDIGVSHGFQWPTLLEALSRRPGGPPPLVRLTVVPPTLDNHQIPFANCPPGYDFASNIYRFAKDLNINLQINRLDNCPLQSLNSQVISSSPDETLIVSVPAAAALIHLLEGKPAKALINTCEMNQKKEKWGERMNGVGFVENAFAEDVVDQARALLKKYDSHWEMRVDEKDGSVGLWWKGQSVSFCSLWKIDAKTSDSYSV